jgi:hypothetical protein
MQDLRSLIAEEKARRARIVSFVRTDAKRDAYAEVKRRDRNLDVVLPDHTRKFEQTIKHPIPETGQVLFQNIPIFASPGIGKTILAQSIALSLIEFYGREKVSVYISDHLPSLVDALRLRATPVVILIVDDALKNYNSRGGGDKELTEAIGLFTTLRHEYEEAHNTLNGIVFVLFTSQMFMGIEKVFREGVPIFKASMTSDKDEIMKQTQMGATAWEYLEQIERDIKVHRRKDRYNDSVVLIPGYGAGRLRMEMKDTPLLRALLAESDSDLAKEALDSGHVAVMFKALERIWTIQRTRLTKEQELARLDKVMDDLARRFASEGRDGEAVEAWLSALVFSPDVEEGKAISTTDYLKLKEASNIKLLRKKIETAKKSRAFKYIGDHGFEVDGRRDPDAVISYVAKTLLEEGMNPFDKNDKERILSRIYKLPPEIREDARQLRVAIQSRMKDIYMGTHGVPQKKGPRDQEEPEVEAVDLAEHLEAVASAGDAEFNVDPQALLGSLIEQAKLKNDEMRFRDLVVHRAVRYLEKYDGRTLGTHTEIATTVEGMKWQGEMFGQAFSRPVIAKSEKRGKLYLYNHVGLLYEVWVAKKLREGFTIKGVFDKAPIAEVIHSGGNGHDPDLIVVYADGTRDFVSLKCYNEQGTVSITTNPRKTDEIQPERHALRETEVRGEHGNRLVVLLRNLYYDGLQAARVFTSSRDIPETLSFNKSDIGYSVWVAPAGRAEEGSGDLAQPAAVV